VRDGVRFRIVPVSSIRWIQACGNYVEIHIPGRELLHRATLGELARRLPPRAFTRIHRGVIVNVAEIAEIRRSSHGDGEVELKDGTVLPLSRRYRAGLL